MIIVVRASVSMSASPFCWVLFDGAQSHSCLLAKEVQASEDSKDFEKAFDKVVLVKSPPAKKK
jgi:hypothetical protein